MHFNPPQYWYKIWSPDIVRIIEKNEQIRSLLFQRSPLGWLCNLFACDCVCISLILQSRSVKVKNARNRIVGHKKIRSREKERGKSHFWSAAERLNRNAKAEVAAVCTKLIEPFPSKSSWLPAKRQHAPLIFDSTSDVNPSKTARAYFNVASALESIYLLRLSPQTLSARKIGSHIVYYIWVYTLYKQSRNPLFQF